MDMLSFFKEFAGMFDFVPDIVIGNFNGKLDLFDLYFRLFFPSLFFLLLFFAMLFFLFPMYVKPRVCVVLTFLL